MGPPHAAGGTGETLERRQPAGERVKTAAPAVGRRPAPPQGIAHESLGIRDYPVDNRLTIYRSYYLLIGTIFAANSGR